MKIGMYASYYDETGYFRFGADTYKKLKEHGYDCIDFNISRTDIPLYSANKADFEAFLQEHARLANEAGVEIYQVHGPWRWPCMDTTEEDRAERMEKMKTAARACAVLGCKHLVIHPIMPFGTDERDTELAKETRNINLKFMRELVDYSKSFDVTVCIENMPMPKFSLGSVEEIMSLVSEINDDHFAVCLDTGHVNVYRGPDGDIARAVRLCASKLKTLHVHDNKFNFDLHLMPFDGDLRWERFSSALKEVGYNGCFSLEVAPPSKLPDELFEEMSRFYVKLSENILSL